MKTLTIVALQEKKDSMTKEYVQFIQQRNRGRWVNSNDAVFVKQIIKWWIACYTLVDGQKRMTLHTKKCEVTGILPQVLIRQFYFTYFLKVHIYHFATQNLNEYFNWGL